MFGFSNSVSKMHNRNRRAVSFLLLAGALNLGGALSLPAHAQEGRLNIQQLGDALTSYGKNTVSNNGQTYYTVTFGKGSWHSNVVISLSPNGNIIWMTVDPAPLPAGKASAAALAELLKKNGDIGPMFFSINGNWLRLSYPVPNHDMDTGKVKAYVEAVVNEVFDTHDLWDSKTLGGY
jgi:hypothetical protein